MLAFSSFAGIYTGTGVYNLSNLKTYALIGDVIFSYNHAFCQEVQAESYGTGVPDDKTANATLYLLNSRPSLTESQHLNISLENWNILDSTSWNFHMNKGSDVSYQFCYQSNDSSAYNVDFFLIKGVSNYLNWVTDDRKSSKFALKFQHLTSECQTIQFEVQHDDTYYFALHTVSHNPDLSFNILLEADLIIYHISKDTIVHNCSFRLDGVSSCSVPTAVSSSLTAVLSLRTPDPYYYVDEADVKITCRPRVWLIFTVSLCCVFAIFAITVVLAIGAHVYMRKKFSSDNLITYTQLEEEGGNLLNAASDTT